MIAEQSPTSYTITMQAFSNSTGSEKKPTIKTLKNTSYQNLFYADPSARQYLLDEW